MDGISITVVSEDADLDRFIAAITGESTLAFDVGGVNLSRMGIPTYCTVGINTARLLRVSVFLFYFNDDATRYQRRLMSTLRGFLEDPNVIKIIHDCRQDSDTLYEFFLIQIRNVFDTSVYNLEIDMATKRDNLNDTLAAYGLPPNPARHKKFYKHQPLSSPPRPLTEEHIRSAAQDIRYLFLLQQKMTDRMRDMSEQQKVMIQSASMAAISEYREKRYTAFIKLRGTDWHDFMGPGGSFLSLIEEHSDVSVSCHNADGFLLLASSSLQIKFARKFIKDRIWDFVSHC